VIDPLYDEKGLEYFDLIRDEVICLIPAGTRRLLDVGCGAGATARAAKEKLGIEEIWGIESVEQAAAKARERLDRVIVGDAESIQVPAPDGYFDVLLCADFLEHTRDPWQTLEKLARWLAPQGALIVSLPNLRHLRPLVHIVLDRFEYEESGILDRTHLRFFTRSSMRSLIEGAGFTIERETSNRSRSLRYDAAVALTLGLLKPFTVYQYLFLARRAPRPVPARLQPTPKDGT
jgi:ubiquinone/menaquinone biosynthesis C-methylase UbiE